MTTLDKNNYFPVFVYGSLKRGFSNNHYLKDSNFIGRYQTETPYLMLSLGGFPGVVKNTSNYFDYKGYILGEFYKINRETLASLDRLEGNGHFYNREIINIVNIDNNVEIEKAWIYFLKHSTINLARDRFVMPYKNDQISWTRKQIY